MNNRNVVVVAHTHWDREWYRPFQAYRTRLIELVDRVVEMLDSGRLPHFLLDGQTVMLDDYLEVVPERRPTLERLIRSGQLAIGPWYILPDEFLVSGEALVRNLLAGKARMEAFGGTSTIGYLPDMFGHVAQIPQIMLGFGLDRGVVWRGVDPEHERFWWRAPSGQRLETLFLPTGYCNLLFWSPMPLEERRKQFDAFLEAHHGQTLLLLSGCDHLAPNLDLPEIVAAIQESWQEGNLRIGRMEEALISDEAPATEVWGELRQGGRAYLLPDVLSARTYLKQANMKVQLQYERLVEPLTALVAHNGGADWSALVREGWIQILLNQPHDSICGCSVDVVHREMLARFSQAENLGADLIERSLLALAPRGTEPGLVVFNPVTGRRSGWFDAVVEWPLADAPDRIRLLDESGAEVPIEILRVEDTRDFQAEVDIFPDWHGVRKFHVSVWLEDLAPAGIRRLRAVAGSPADLATPLEQGPNAISNGHLRLGVREGRLLLEDLDTGVVIQDLQTFVDGGDAGDEYNYSPPAEDRLVESTLEHWMVERVTASQATLRVAFRLEVPERLSDDRLGRSRRTVPMIILSRFTLRAGARWVEVETDLDNRARDHRLRLRIGTGLPADDTGVRAFGESSFWVQERPVSPEAIPLPVAPQKEAAPTTFPQQGWSAVEGDWGLMVAAHGLHEVEVVTRESNDRALDLTLIRAVGWLSRDDLRTRGGGAGPAMETPEAQCLGPHRFSYAILPYRGPWTVAMPLATGFLSPVVSQSVGAHRAGRAGGLTAGKWLVIEDDRVVLSTVKRAENGDGTILRVFNPTDRYFETELEVTLPHQALVQSRLDEVDQAVLGQGRIPLRMGPGEILTLRVRPERPV